MHRGFTGRTLFMCAVLSTGLTISCGDGGAGAPVTIATTTSATVTTATTATTAAPTTTTRTPPTSTSSTLPVTTTTTTMFTVPPAPLPESTPRLLVAGATGIDLWSREGTTRVLAGGPIAAAVPDLTGGVVFQREIPDESGFSLMPIEWIRALGESPQVLVGGSDEALYLTLVQVAMVDGSPALFYREWVELENDCGVTAESCRWGYLVEWLHLLDLATMEDHTLAAVGGFEGDSVSVRVGGDVFAVDIEGYGDGSACVGYRALGTLLAGRPGPDLRESCDMGPTPECPPGGWCAGTIVAAPADDGATLAYAVAPWAQDVAGPDRVWYAPEVVFVETTTGREISRHGIGTAGRVHPTFLDFDGRYVVVGRYDASLGDDWGTPNLAPLLIRLRHPVDTVLPADEEPLMWELPIDGRVTIWRETGAS